MAVNREEMDAAILKAFREYDEKATVQLRELVDQAYTRAKSETTATLRAENADSFENIRVAAAANLDSLQKSTEATIAQVDAKLEQINPQSSAISLEFTKFQQALEAGTAENARIRAVGENMEQATSGLRTLDASVRDFMVGQQKNLDSQFRQAEAQIKRMITEAKESVDMARSGPDMTTQELDSLALHEDLWTSRR